MALPSSGQISMEQVRTELKGSGQISLGDTAVRDLAKKTSGQISMSDLHGKSAMYVGTITSFGNGNVVINPTHFKGLRIYGFWYRSNPSGYIMNFILEGSMAQSEVKRIRLLNGSSVVHDTNSPNSGSMTPEFTNNGSYTTWKFGYFSSSPSGTYTVEIS